MRKRNHLLILSFVTAVLLVAGVPIVKNKFWPSPSLVIDVHLTMCLQFAPKQDIFWTGQNDGIVKEWDARSGELLRSIKCSSVVWCLCLSDDGKLLFIGCDDGTIVCYDVQSHKRLRVWRCGQKPLHISCTANGTTVAIAGLQLSSSGQVSVPSINTLTLWKLQTSEEIKLGSITKQFKRVTAMKFDAQDKLIIGDAAGVTAIINWKQKILQKKYVLQGIIAAIDLRKDGDIIIANYGVATISHKHKQASYIPTNVEFTVGGHLQTADFCLSKNLLIGFAWDSVLHIWDVGSGTELRAVRRSEGTEEAAKFSPDGELIVCAYYDRIEVWKTSELTN